jgi:hypothetical protein
LAIAQGNAPVDASPHSQVVKAATGRRSCSLPVTMSGAKTLITVTATQIPAIPAAVQAVHDRSAIIDR